ncbi:MAG: hypothetical protein VXY89_16530, partial [SAR324 cluster bacterium]|nr:hypothetical protein [SAR324 cluster bacterium]
SWNTAFIRFSHGPDGKPAIACLFQSIRISNGSCTCSMDADSTGTLGWEGFLQEWFSFHNAMES